MYTSIYSISYSSGTSGTDLWKPNVISDENIENTTSNFAPTSVDHHVLSDTNLNNVNNNISIPKKVINLHIYYILNPWLRNFNTDVTLEYFLFGSVKVTENTDPDKYKDSGYGIEFYSFPDFSITDVGMKTMLLFL